MVFEAFNVQPRPRDSQTDLPSREFLCTDGMMRTAYEKYRFEQRVRWTWLGFVVDDPTDTGSVM